MGNGTIVKLKKIYDAISEFVAEKWIETEEEAKASRLHRFAHFWVLVYKSFYRNRCPARATALAYTTLLALVPILAVVGSVTTGMLQGKGEDSTRQMIEKLVDTVVPQLRLAPHPAAQGADPRQEVVDRLMQFVSNIQTKTLGATGIIGLIVVAIMLLSTIEDTFNDIWGVSRGRNWFRRLVQYWTTISLGPIVLAAGLALLSSGYLQSGQAFLKHWYWLWTLLFKALPFLLVTTAFALLYKLMPNTQVNWGAALIGGFVGGSLWLVLNIFNGVFLSRVLSMSNIYGPLSIVPIFLVGMYFSWLIVLFGAQVGYAYQNRVVYVQEKKAESVSQRGREYVALRLMTYMAQRFDRGQSPPTLQDLATELGVPSRLVSMVLAPLIDNHLVLEVNVGGEVAYTPGRPIENITCYDVIETLRAGGGQELVTRDDPSRAPVCAEFEHILHAERQGAAVTLKELVRRVPAATPQPDNGAWHKTIPEQSLT